MDTVLILDFGGQYKELIARRVRECKVYSEIRSGNITIDEIMQISPIGIIFTGGPMSVYNDYSPKCNPAVLELGIPVLGICYGHQLLAYMSGGTVESCEIKEYGRTEIMLQGSELFYGLPAESRVLMSHIDQVTQLPSGFKSIANTAACPNAAIENVDRKLYGVQFHPEVDHTDNGKKIIHNFLYRICGANGDYSMADYKNKQIKAIRETVGNDKVLLGLSGGVDSSVCAALLSEAIHENLMCVFVDHGLMRKNEGDQIEEIFSKRNLRFIRVNAEERFLNKLKGITEPEAKRKIIGAEFINVFEEQAKLLGDIKYLAQGTIYPDVIESGANNSANIKSHHNVGGLPERMDFKGIIEPLRGLFKDEVRKLGKQLKLPLDLINRQPFPGPGLAIRVIGEITKEKLDILREADAIFCEEIKINKIKAHQYFAVLTNLQSVGVMGDKRTYDYTIALRAVETSDFMTCKYAKIPHTMLDRVSARLVNEVVNINRVVYDITNKPPATIEWE